MPRAVRPNSGGMTDTTASTRITTPFGFTSTAAEVVEGVDLLADAIRTLRR